MEIKRDVFQAIADPTRRHIIEMLAQRSLNLNEIAENFDISRQAVSVHVRILTECGLILIKKQGRERYCEAKLDKLNEVVAWVDHCKQFWTTQFNSLDKYLEKKTKKMIAHSTNEKTAFVYVREFDAPKELVFNACNGTCRLNFAATLAPGKLFHKTSFSLSG